MKTIELTEVIKEEVVITSTKRKIGKIMLDNKVRTLTVIGDHFTLVDIQNALLIATSESYGYIPIPFAGDTIFPQDWTIILKSKE